MGKPSHRGHLRRPPRQAWDRYQRQREFVACALQREQARAADLAHERQRVSVGTTGSSVPCTTSVGTSISPRRSRVRSPPSRTLWLVIVDAMLRVRSKTRAASSRNAVPRAGTAARGDPREVGHVVDRCAPVRPVGSVDREPRDGLIRHRR